VTIPEPNYANSLVTSGRLDPPLVRLLKALVSAANGTGATDLSGLATTAELTELRTQLENMHGINGVTVLGSLASGLVIQGNEGESILAAQIFGG